MYPCWEQDRRTTGSWWLLYFLLQHGTAKKASSTVWCPLWTAPQALTVTVLGRGELVSLFLISTLESNIHSLFSDQNYNKVSNGILPMVTPPKKHTRECHRVLERLWSPRERTFLWCSLPYHAKIMLLKRWQQKKDRPYPPFATVSILNWNTWKAVDKVWHK